MTAQRRRLWAVINQALGQRLVFAGYVFWAYDELVCSLRVLVISESL